MEIKYTVLATLTSILSLTLSIELDMSGNMSKMLTANETRSKILSRRKRFLVFPEGSSVQIVFETQNHGYMQVGDIVWFSETAALAWELPTDPEIYLFFKNGNKDFQAKRREDSQNSIYYLDDKGKVQNKAKYKKKRLLVPVFGKRSVDDQKAEDEMNKDKIKEMHKHHKATYYNEADNLNCSSVNFHRNKRKELYEKVDMYLENLGWRGRDCVLKMLCQSGNAKSNNFQGSFMEEILQSVFTLPNGKRFEDPDHQEYETAHKTPGDCDFLYPDCSQNEIGLPQQFIVNNS